MGNNAEYPLHALTYCDEEYINAIYGYIAGSFSILIKVKWRNFK